MPFIRVAALICLPILMLCDYYLTLAGKKLRDKVYSNHLSSEEYELNPAWQKDVNKLKKFNYKHILAIILITGYLYFIALLVSDNIFSLIYGFLFILYVYIVMRHLQNLLTYHFINKNPEQLSGKVYMGHIFSLKTSQYNSLVTGLMLLVISIWTQSWFILGGAGSMFVFCLTQLRWIKRYKKRLKQKNEAIPQPESTT